MPEEAQPVATELTPEQYKYLEWVATPKGLRKPKTVAAFAKTLGADRTTLWRWSKTEAFRKEFRQAGRSLLENELPDIYAALAKAAVEGDVPAIKLALEVSGEFVPKQDLTTGGEKLNKPTIFLPAPVEDDG